MTELEECHPILQERWSRVAEKYRSLYPGRKLLVTCGNRSVEEQQELFSHGRSKPGPVVTQLDGVNQKSNHNVTPSRALDFCVVLQGKATWNPSEYRSVGTLAEAEGLIWGGNWPHFKDNPHIELPKDVQ